MKKVCPCGEKSIPGLINNVSLCQKHYNYLMFDAWETDTHKEGVLMLNYNKQGITTYNRLQSKGDKK